MSYPLRSPNRWLVFLLLALLSSGISGGMRLCLMPDGGVHVEEGPAHCGLSGEPGAVTGDFREVEDGHGSCVDLAIEDKSSLQRNMAHPPGPSLSTQEQPPSLALTAKPLAAYHQASRSPHLLPLQSVILRI